MKMKRTPKFLRKLKHGSPFDYPKADYPNVQEALERVAIVMSARPTKATDHPLTDSTVTDIDKKALAAIATSVWKAKSRLHDAGTAEGGGVLGRVLGDITRIWNTLVDDLGLEIKDHTGEAFDYGLPLQVVTSQPTQGITKERVIETIKPTIRWRNKTIQMGAVVIATPI
jgi:hypothetical protein